MAKAKVESLITQSLLERLAKDMPMPSTPRASKEQYKDSVRQDVQRLLNTRQPLLDLEGYPLAAASVINYGLPDIQAYGGSEGRDQNALTASLLRTLRMFEPRLRQPRVYLSKLDAVGRKLSLHIEGVLKFENMEEEITFDTVVELIRGDIKVE